MQRIVFPLNNPVALIDLYCSDMVYPVEWLGFINAMKHPVFNNWLKFHPVESWWIRSLLKLLLRFDKALRETKVVKEVKKILLEQIGKLTLMQILKGLDLVIEKIKETGDAFTSQSVSTIFDSLATYEWTNDTNAPLGFERTVNDLVDGFKQSANAAEEIQEAKANLAKRAPPYLKDLLSKLEAAAKRIK